MLFPQQVSEMVTKCQLFYGAGEAGFLDDNSMSCLVKLNNLPQCVQFNLPAMAQAPSGLRFDFADTPAAIVILSIAVRDEAQVAQWEWDGNVGLFSHLEQSTAAAVTHGKPAVLLTGLGLDPHCLLGIPLEALAQMKEGWHVEVVLAPQENPLHGLFTCTLEHEIKVAALSKLFIAQKQHVDQLLEENRLNRELVVQLVAENKAARELAERQAGENRFQQLALARFEENDMIVRQKLAEHDGLLKNILASKWLRRLFSLTSPA